MCSLCKQPIRKLKQCHLVTAKSRVAVEDPWPCECGKEYMMDLITTLKNNISMKNYTWFCRKNNSPKIEATVLSGVKGRKGQDGCRRQFIISKNCKSLREVFFFPGTLYTVPCKSIGMARPIYLVLLYSEDIWVWDLKMNITQDYRQSDSK